MFFLESLWPFMSRCGKNDRYCKYFLGMIAGIWKHTESRSGFHSIKAVNPADAGYEDYGYKKKFHIDKNAYRKVLITGAGFYIGESFKKYCKSCYPNIECTAIDMLDGSWREYDFSRYDTVFHVAGIDSSNAGKTTFERRDKYYKVNTGLAVE